jgi:hypothetical protein
MVSFQIRALVRLGRLDEAKVLRDELRTRAADEYIGEGVWLTSLMFDDRDDIEAALRLNIEVGTGPTTLSSTVDRELEALLPDPRLGPLVRQLSLYANRTL